ncbi:MAG: hypothetical protein WHT07_11895 [Desulfobaccales bacterium]
MLNLLSGIIGGIWLAILGEWRLIGYGFLFMIFLPIILSFLMVPGIAISGLALYLFEKKSKLTFIFQFLSITYTNLLMVITCIFAFIFCSSFYTGGINLNYVPYLLWSWGMALGPWQYFASKEQDNEFTQIHLFNISLFYFLFLLSIFIFPSASFFILIIFSIIQFIILPTYFTYISHRMKILLDQIH